MTHGFRSTEFWHASATWLVGLGLCALGLFPGYTYHLLAGAFLLAASTWAYSHSRGRAKAPRPYLPPGGKL